MQHELDIFNAMLDLRGEREITSAEMEDHPKWGTFMRHLADAKRDVLSRGWWANRIRTTLVPTTNGIPRPEGALVVRPIPDSLPYNFLGGVMVNMETGRPVATPVEVYLHMDMTLAEMSPALYSLIKDQTLLRSSASYAQGSDVALIRERAAQTQLFLIQEDTRQRALNRADNDPTIAAIRRTRGSYGYRIW